MKTLEQIKPALQNEVVKYFEEGKDGLAVAIQKEGVFYKIIASWGDGWDHVSMSLDSRCPAWAEMCWVKELFWNAEETVVQYHPAKSRYVDCHPNCLHLWKPQKQTLPLPPIHFV